LEIRTWTTISKKSIILKIKLLGDCSDQWSKLLPECGRIFGVPGVWFWHYLSFGIVSIEKRVYTRCTDYWQCICACSARSFDHDN